MWLGSVDPYDGQHAVAPRTGQHFDHQLGVERHVRLGLPRGGGVREDHTDTVREPGGQARGQPGPALSIEEERETAGLDGTDHPRVGRVCLIFSQTVRRPNGYKERPGLATIRSTPCDWSVSHHPRASVRLSVLGVAWTGGPTSCRTSAKRARRLGVRACGDGTVLRVRQDVERGDSSNGGPSWKIPVQGVPTPA